MTTSWETPLSPRKQSDLSAWSFIHGWAQFPGNVIILPGELRESYEAWLAMQVEAGAVRGNSEPELFSLVVAEDLPE